MRDAVKAGQAQSREDLLARIAALEAELRVKNSQLESVNKAIANYIAKVMKDATA